MDRFLEEQEGVRDRSSSPNVNCLLHGDAKRQRTSTIMANNHTESGKSESWDGTTSEEPLVDLSNTETLVPITATTSPSSLLPPPAPPPPVPPATIALASSPSSFSVPSGMAQINSPPTPLQNHDSNPHDFSPSSDNVLPHLPS